MADTTRAQPLMRTVIKENIGKMFEQDAILLDLFLDGKNSKNNALGAGLPAYVGANPSFGSMPDGGYFPPPGETKDVVMKVFSTDQAQTGHITGRLLDTPSDLMLANGLDFYTNRDGLTFKKKLNQMCYGDGSGSRGTVSAIAGLNITFGGAIGASQLLNGAAMQFYTPAGVQRVGGGVTVSTISADPNMSTGVVAFDAVPTDVAVGDIIVYKDSFGMAFHGLAYHVNDDAGMYQGVSRGTYSSLRATVIDAAGAALSVSLMDRLLRKLRVVAGVNVPQNDIVMISHPDQELAYRQIGYTLNRVVPLGQGTSKFDLAFGQASHQGLRWKLDTDCPRDRIYFIRLSSLQTFMNRKPGLFIDENGDSLRLKPGSGIHAWDYQYEFLASGDIGCSMSNANGVLKNLALVA